jgi:hypothetical protein
MPPLKVRILARPPASGPAPQDGVVWCAGFRPSKRTTPPERNMIARRRCVLELGPQIPSASLIMLSFRSGSVDVDHSAATRRILRPLEECPARRSQGYRASRLDGEAPCNRHRALALVHYLLSRRNSSIASRIASSRSHFFLSIHRLIRACFPSFEVVMKTLLNSRSIPGSTRWAF